MAIGAVVVSDDNKNLDGILSERDILLALDERGAEALLLTAGDLMTADVFTCTSDTLVAQVLSTMVDYGVRHLPVVGDHGLEGMISMRDVVQLRLSALEKEVDHLRRQQQGGPQAAG
jgi:CBS domain-containing protein